jgi:hypothetical protein
VRLAARLTSPASASHADLKARCRSGLIGIQCSWHIHSQSDVQCVWSPFLRPPCRTGRSSGCGLRSDQPLLLGEPLRDRDLINHADLDRSVGLVELGSSSVSCDLGRHRLVAAIIQGRA